jgi:hypothetical protein
MCDCQELEASGAGGVDLCETRLPADPFTAIQFHYGMLLGVDDLETTQSYARGKMRLHNAWLHGEGVVWGFGVDIDTNHHLRVLPGLALDAAGHELHLDSEMCLDLGDWYEKHKSDPDFSFTVDGRSVRFAVRVVVAFRSCLSRQIPALRDPCNGAATDTAYSRAVETVTLRLEPVPATMPSPTEDPRYRMLRVFFGLAVDDAQNTFARAVELRNNVLVATPEDQPLVYLRAFRELAALDEIALLPQSDADHHRNSIYPRDPARVVLADVTEITLLAKDSGGWDLQVTAAPDAVPSIDPSVRPSHVATSTIQELQWLPLLAALGPTPEQPVAARVSLARTADAGEPRTGDAGDTHTGPTIVNAELQSQAVRFRASEALASGSLDEAAFSVTFWSGEDGWVAAEVRDVEPLADGVSYRVVVREKLPDSKVRFIARGTGPAPILSDATLRPLGAPGLSGPDDGTDFVAMLERS